MDRRRPAAHQKNAARRRAHLIFIDETGFLMLPIVRRNWAPIGKTPVLRHRARHHQKVSVIGGLSLSPRRRVPNLYMQLYTGANITEEEVVVFLRHVLRHLRGNVTVIWDNINQHRSRLVRAFIRSHRRRLRVEWLPPYAPELNPAEGIWCHLKAHRLAGRATSIPLRDA